jgi:hypothetical protein
MTQLLDRLSALLGVTIGPEDLLLFPALVAPACFLLFRLRKRRRDQIIVMQQRVVFALLDTAIAQRSVMELEFSSPEAHGRKVSGPCSEVRDDRIVVDLGLEYSVQSWIGETVEVSFKLDYKNTSTYYRFPSRIAAMHTGARDLAVEIDLPDYIYPTQKRNYVRIRPTPGHILGMGLWSLDPMLPLPLDSTALGRAVLSYRPGKVLQCVLLNISAGGMRIAVPKALSQQFPIDLTLQSHILCLLLLRSQDGGEPMPFWLVCTVPSLFEDQEHAQVIIGLKFKVWALSEAGSSDILWFPVGKSGEVAPLASWVLRHQLEQNKRQL